MVALNFGNKMKSNTSVLNALGMDRVLGIAEEPKMQTKMVADRFGDTYCEPPRRCHRWWPL
jgi:hypothetical protein